MSRRKQKWLSYPKAIAVMAVLCTFVMIKFQTPSKHTKTSNKKASRKIVHKVKQATLGTRPLESANVKTEDIKQPASSSLKEFKLCADTLTQLGKERDRSVFLYERGVVKAQKIKKTSQSKIKKIKIAKAVTKPARRTKAQLKKTLSERVLQYLESSELDTQDAVDNPAPLDEIAHQSFQEPVQSEAYDSNPLVAMVSLSNLLDPILPFQIEKPLQVRESLFQKISFSDLDESLLFLREMEDHLESSQLPKQRLAWSKLTEFPPVVSKEMIEPQKALQVTENEKSLEEIKETQADVPEPAVENKKASSVVTEERTNNPPLNSEPALMPKRTRLGPSMASASSLVEETFGEAMSVANLKPLNTQAAIVSKKAETLQVNSQAEQADDESSDHSRGGTFFGELSVDNATLSWLESQKGHIELSLHREGSKDPQDTIFLMDYQFPASGSRFELEGDGLRGRYRLIAGVYIPNSAIPVAQIPYAKLISNENYKEKIQLVINKNTFSGAKSRAASQIVHDFVPLNLTLFDGAPSNYRKPKVLKAGEVSIVGMSELGKFPVDSEGNIRIPQVPVASELVIEARAPGYYPTRQIIPIFSSAAYAPIYLVEKDKVDVVTQYFTKRPQQSEKSVVLGRIYDLKTRTPQAGESLSLSHRKGSAVYFGALPDLNSKTTLDTGLFGFYNVEPSIRTLNRERGQYSLLLNMKPNFGYFVEFGRGGARDFKGGLTDPFLRKEVFGSVQLVGSSSESVETQSNGRFKFEQVDLPPGVLTFEAYAEGYPRTWFTVPWSVRESIKEHSFYMMERDLIKESANRIARMRHEKNTGVIVGGAHTSLFRSNRTQLRVLLMDSAGLPVAIEHGPFSLTQVPETKAGFRLSPKDPGFAFYNLTPGEYLLKMLDDRQRVVKCHVIRVGVERVSVVVN